MRIGNPYHTRKVLYQYLTQFTVSLALAAYDKKLKEQLSDSTKQPNTADTIKREPVTL